MKNRLMILALAVTVLVAKLVGASLPILAKRLGFDPAAGLRQAGGKSHHRTGHHRQRNHHTRGNHSKKPRRGTERGRI